MESQAFQQSRMNCLLSGTMRPHGATRFAERELAAALSVWHEWIPPIDIFA